MINALNRHLGTSGQLPAERAMLFFFTCPTLEKLPNIKCIDGACKMRPLNVFCGDIYGCQDVLWKKWTRIDGKFEPIERKGSIRDLLSDLQNALEEPTKGTSFVQHLFVAFWQQSQFKICKTNSEESYYNNDLNVNSYFVHLIHNILCAYSVL
uniref:Uncharacterized protein n=1 Tax=Biomphalaria glabrata TaxID=6526 RepID=A0A2C9M3P6_BIOGL